MSQYTTGELAKLCGVTVRTVQYYDARNILVPSALTEGGRRLYSEEDLHRMRVICFLRDLGLPINSIGQLLSEAEPEAVLELLLDQQETLLRQEIVQRQLQLQKLELLRKGTQQMDAFSVENIGDIAYQMEHRKKLWRVRGLMLGVGIPLEILEWLTFFYALRTGTWWPFLAGLALVVLGSAWMSWYYYKSVKYICPHCHTVFKPTLRQMFFANHTPNTRKLTCTSCGKKSFCVEVYGGKES